MSPVINKNTNKFLKSGILYRYSNLYSLIWGNLTWNISSWLFFRLAQIERFFSSSGSVKPDDCRSVEQRRFVAWRSKECNYVIHIGANITRGLYIFYPVFNCGLYCRAVNSAEQLVFHNSFFLIQVTTTKKKTTQEERNHSRNLFTEIQ